MRPHRRRSGLATGFVWALIVVCAAGCGSSFHLGGGARKVVASFLYFRPVLCSIPAYNPNGPVSAGPTFPVDGLPSSRVCSASNAAEIASTSPVDDSATATVVLAFYDNSVRYVMGPADLDGSSVASTSVTGDTSGGFQVELRFTQPGAAEFNRVASERYPYYAAHPSNPPNQSLEAIELNGTVVAVDTIQSERFNGFVVISGSQAAPLTSKQASGLAGELDRARNDPPLAPAPGPTTTTNSTTG